MRKYTRGAIGDCAAEPHGSARITEGNICHIGEGCNAVIAHSDPSRRAHPTSPAALLGHLPRGMTLPCVPRLAARLVGHAEMQRTNRTGHWLFVPGRKDHPSNLYERISDPLGIRKSSRPEFLSADLPD